MTSSVLMAFFDLPWTPIFLFGIAIFHPWLGMLAVAGGFVLIIVAVLNQIMTREPLGQLSQAVFRSERIGPANPNGGRDDSFAWNERSQFCPLGRGA